MTTLRSNANVSRAFIATLAATRRASLNPIRLPPQAARFSSKRCYRFRKWWAPTTPCARCAPPFFLRTGVLLQPPGAKRLDRVALCEDVELEAVGHAELVVDPAQVIAQGVLADMQPRGEPAVVRAWIGHE